MRLKFLLLLQGLTPQAPAVRGLRSRRAGQMNGAGLSPTKDWKCSGEPGCRRIGGGGGGPCMCLCTVYGSHRVHLFKNQKRLFLYHQGFFAKTRNYKKKRRKKKSVSAVHSKACVLFLQAAAFSPHLGSFCGPHVGKLYPGGSFLTSNLKVAPANI